MTFDSIHEDNHLYFITATVCGWKHLFSLPGYPEIMLESFSWLIDRKRMMLFGYVVMPNHVHAILKPVDLPIGSLIHDFGSFTAHRIIKRLKSEDQWEWLNFFNMERRDERSNYSVWQDIQAKNIFSTKFLYQKLEYVHNNPVTERWELVKDRADYPYSSAGFYDRGDAGLTGIRDVREYIDVSREG